MKPPYTVREEDFKGPAYRLNRLIKLLCDNIPDEAPRPGSTHAASTDLVLYGTRTDRLTLTPPASHLGALYVENDEENTVYQSQYRSNVATWAYVSGTYFRTQAQLAALAATLGTADTGLLVWVTTYKHILYWNGTGWQFPAQDLGSAYIQAFAVAPGVGWQLCDGTVTSYLNSDGTTTAYTTPVLTGGAYLKYAAAAGAAVTAANAPGQPLQTVAAGAGQNVVHSVDATGQPAHIDLLPYFRR